jgi:hypothetical protein
MIIFINVKTPQNSPMEVCEIYFYLKFIFLRLFWRATDNEVWKNCFYLKLIFFYIFRSFWRVNKVCEICFYLKLFFYIFRSFWRVDIKNKFLKKIIILIYFWVKNNLKSINNHTLKHFLNLLMLIIFSMIFFL